MAKDQFNYGKEKEKKGVVSHTPMSELTPQELVDEIKEVYKFLASMEGEAVDPKAYTADLVAKFPSGTKWVVQVRSTTLTRATSKGQKKMSRLKQVATKSNVTPVVANVGPEGIEYESARSGRKLTPPKSKKK